MTRYLLHNLKEGKSLEVKVDGEVLQTYTVPAGKYLKISAVEHWVFTQGKRVVVTIDGTERLDFTVPANKAILIETNLKELP